MRVRAFFLALLSLLLVAATPQEKKAATAKLLAAAAEGDEDEILAAVAAGADVNARDPEKNTPLILMASQSLFGKERKIVEAMVAAKARVDDSADDGVTALMVASSAGRDGMVRLLLQNGAKVDKPDNDGWTPLMYASGAGHWSVVKELIDAEADVNHRDKKGWSPIVLALYNGRGSAAENLIKAGAKLPEQGPNGMSMALMATYGRDLACVEHVIKSGAKLDGVDEDGWCSLAVAASNGDAQIVMELLRAGANPAIKDKEGKTAVDRARQYKLTEIASLLGDPWKKTLPSSGTTVTIPCSGDVKANFTADESLLTVTTLYPKPLTYYIGGDKPFTPTYALGDLMLGYSQYGTSVTLEYQDSKGNPRQKQVYAHVLDVRAQKKETDIEFGDESPRPINDEGVLVTKFPMEPLGLKKGKTVPLTAQIGNCTPVKTKVKL